MKTTKRFNCLRTYAKTCADTGLVAGTSEDLIEKLTKVEQAFTSLQNNIGYDDYLVDLASTLENALVDLGLAIEDILLEEEC